MNSTFFIAMTSGSICVLTHLSLVSFLWDIGKQCRTRSGLFVCLILNIPSTIFQLNRDGSSWVEPVLS